MQRDPRPVVILPMIVLGGLWLLTAATVALTAYFDDGDPVTHTALMFGYALLAIGALLLALGWLFTGPAPRRSDAEK